ncbi:hypothetical protein RND81_05G130500 [Saponaria officinalis]|uniref:Uncharacterized protein n=1 Tax=Saponaria officinalis TaxID=3572 RepID=A0AAW1L0G7_SAPOF
MELASEMAETIAQKVDSSKFLVQELSVGKRIRRQLGGVNDALRTLRAKLKDSRVWVTMSEDKADVKEWLKKVRSTLYELEHLVDEIYAQAATTDGSSIAVLRLKLNLHWSCGKIRESREKLKQLVEHTPNALTAEVVVARRETEKTQDAVLAAPLVGRCADRNEIVGMLQQPGNFSAVVISGMAGLGKTTLAQLVFNYFRLPGFNARLWVWVGSELNPSSIVSRVHEEMAVREANARKTVSSNDPIATPQENKLLLVLDDVRSLDEGTLNSLRDSSMSMLVPAPSATVKIVITTRNEKVATASYGNIPTTRHALGAISDEEAWTLFKKVAFNNVNEDSKLLDLVWEMLKRTNNVPRTIKDLASLLNGEGKGKWKALMNTEFWRLREGYSPLTFASTLAFRLLPSPLKRCFAYSALLQHNNKIEKRHLIHLWIAQCYIEKRVIDDENESLEEVAEDYYRVLEYWSFLKHPDSDFRLANSVAATEMLALHIVLAQDGSVSGNQQYDCGGIYHLFLSSTSNLSNASSTPSSDTSISLPKLVTSLPPQLRSFLKAKGSTVTLNTSICDRLFSSLGHLRALDLNSSKITVVPDSIVSLKHLRYLNLSLNDFKYLPKSITTLAKLQVLDLSNCENFVKFPTYFYRLKGLRHLYLTGCKSLSGMPVGLRKMTELQTLNLFVLGKTQKCCKLDELSSLNLKSELTYAFAGASQP